MDFRMVCQSGQQWLVLFSPKHSSVKIVNDQEQRFLKILENEIDLKFWKSEQKRFCYITIVNKIDETTFSTITPN